MQYKPTQIALRVSLIYCLVAGVWILLSDRVLVALVSDPEVIGRIAIFKGWAFVAVTALLLYFTLRNQLRRWGLQADARALAEDKVRQLSQAVEQSPVSVIITDTKGNIEYVNRKFSELTGYSFAESVGQNPRILKSGECPPATYQEMWKRIASGETWSGEFHNRKKNGELYWEWATISPVLDASNQITRFLAVKEDITKRKQAEDELRWKTAFLEAQVDSALDGILVVDNQARKILQNQRMNDLMKIPPDIAGNKDDAAQIQFVASRVKNPRQFIEKIGHLNSHPNEISRDEIELMDGTILDRYSSPVRDRAGTCYGRIWTFRDITGRKRDEESLRESEHHYRSLFDNMLNGFAFCRMYFEGDLPRDFTYLNVNPMFETLTGLKDVQGRKATEVIPGVREADPGLFERYGRVARTGVPERFEIYVEALKMWFAIAVYSPKKEYFVAVFDVITERKRAEAALRASEERFRLLTENASDLITVINGEGVIRFESPSVERLLGYQPEELTNRSAFEFVHPEDVAHTSAAIQRALSNPATPITVEFRFRHRDGSWRILQAIGKSVPNQASDGFVVVNSRDITENRKLEAQFRQAQKMETVGQLAGGVAHDFNNLLAVIQLQTGLMKAEQDLLPQQLESANEIQKAAERAANLIRQLLLFSRRQTLQPQALDLAQSINDITNMLRRTLGEDIQLQFKFAMQPLFVHADAGMLGQVLMNLAVNARDAMPNGGRLTIETSAARFDEAAAARIPQARPGSFVCLSVSDTGCGIPPEHLSSVFEPFFTTKDLGKGTGLGLATVFGIVEQHKGWIQVHSEVGRGTTFQIYIPQLDEPPRRHELRSPAPTAMRGGNETILFVEDEASLRASVRRVLSELGYRVLEAVNGLEALEIWSQNRDGIHLLLADVVLPGGINGKALAKRLLQENPGLKVIFVTGYDAGVATGNLPLKEGVNLLRKPFEAHKLVETIRNCLDKT